MHGIIVLNSSVGAGLAPAPDNAIDNLNDGMGVGFGVLSGVGLGAGASPAPKSTVSDMVGAYKSLVANECLKIFKLKNETMGKLWQRDYYEHIIRNEQAYQNISNYIINNPSKWHDDKFFTK